MTRARKAPLKGWLKWLGYSPRFIAALFLYATVVEPELAIRHDRVFTPPAQATRWPTGCEGVRLAVVSDPHIGDVHLHPWRLARIRRAVADSHPDTILIPGDFVAHVLGGSTLPMTEIAQRLADWPSIAPVVAVLGNHDYSNAPVDQALAGIRSTGMTVLNNQAHELVLRGGRCRLWVAGVGDGFSGLDSVPAAMEGIPAQAPVLMISHDPRVAAKADPRRVGLVVAGHAHGGVVCVPFTRQCLSRYHRWTQGWVRGWYHFPDQPPVLVSSGLGNSIFPARFGAPPGWDVVTVHVAGEPSAPSKTASP